MTTNPQPPACRTTQHCAYHGWCRRCAPEFADVMSRVNTAIQRTDENPSHWGPLYEAAAKALRGAYTPDSPEGMLASTPSTGRPADATVELHDEPDDTDLTEPDIDRMMAAGTPVQIVTAPPATFAAVSVPPSAPTDWIDGHPQLEAIAAAVWERCGRSDSGGCVEDDPRTIAVAALAAVLPAPASHSTELNPTERTMLTYALNQARLQMWATGDYTDEEQDAVDSLRRRAALPAPADRAAILRQAADALGRMDYDADNNDYGYDTYRDAWNGGVMDGAALLRRLAAAASGSGRVADETQAEPKPPVGYSGKGRVWCLTCPRPNGEDVPVTVDEVDHWEECAHCGRHVVDVAEAAVSQPAGEA